MRTDHGILPPQAVESEESLISAMLLDASVVSDVLSMVSPEDCYRNSNRHIMASILALSRRADPVDMVTVTQQLRDDGKLEDVGGAAYIAMLTDTVPVAVNVEHYARTVRDKAVLRRLIAVSNEIARNAFEDGVDPQEALASASAAILAIDSGRGGGAVDCGSIVDECVDRLEALQSKNSALTGIPSGFERLDLLTGGWQQSDLIILAARPSMGKTTAAWNMAMNAAEAGVTTCVWELEMDRMQLGFKSISARGRVNGHKFRSSGRISRDDWGRITKACGNVCDLPLYVNDDPTLDHMGVWQDMRRMVRKHGIGLAIVDYLQLMSRGSDLYANVKAISRSFKLAAKELRIPVILLSQLNRKLEERSDKRPILSDLRDSGSIEEDADLVVFIYRDEVYNQDENNPNRGTAEFILAKNRLGPTGTAMAAFIGKYSRFDNLAAHVER